MPPLPWENTTSGKRPLASATSRYDGVRTTGTPRMEITSRGVPATAASVDG